MRTIRCVHQLTLGGREDRQLSITHRPEVGSFRSQKSTRRRSAGLAAVAGREPVLRGVDSGFRGRGQPAARRADRQGETAVECGIWNMESRVEGGPWCICSVVLSGDIQR